MISLTTGGVGALSGGGGGGTRGADAAPRAALASSNPQARSDPRVCSRCGASSRNEHGHVIHCAMANNGDCKGAPSVARAEWDAQTKEREAQMAISREKAEHFRNSEAETLNRERQDMIYNRMTPQTTVDAFDGVLARHDNRLKTEVLRRLGEGKTPAEQATLESNIRDIFEAHQNIQTPGQLNERVQPAPATPRELVDRPDANGKAQGSRTGDHVYDVPICDGLKAVLRDNPSLLEKFRSAAAKWADPTPGESITVYSDITDGAVFRAHPELGINADRSDGSLRVGFMLYFDEVEVVNALGSFTGVHKIGLFYWALLNLDANERMDLKNIHLATIALDADIGYYGMEQIVSGPPGEPNYPDGTSIGASLRALHDGVQLSIGKHGKFIDVLTRGWLVVVSADFPAAAVLSGTMVGTSANRFCRECEVDRREEGYDCPCSFIFPTEATPALRTLASRAEDMATCGDCEEDMKSAGWTSWSHAFIRCGPYFNFLQQIPYDLMHGEGEGLLKGELAHLIFVFIRVHKYFDLDELNHALNGYSFPGGKDVPYFMDGLLKGKTATKVKAKKAAKATKKGELAAKPAAKRGSKPAPIRKKRVAKAKAAAPAPAKSSDDPKFVPEAGCHVHMTASQTLTFALHSPQIFLDLGVDPDDPCFKAWLTHLSYLRLLMKHTLTYDEVILIDQLISQHQNELKALAAFYPSIWKPKHHYACHFASDILNFGPPRHYWCMRFEALNQLFKKIAVGGVYRDTTRRCATFWAIRSALARQAGGWEEWCSTRAVEVSESITFARDEAPSHVVEVIEQFETLVGEYVSTSYVSELQHDGHQIYAGQSWLLIQLDEGDEPLLGFVQPNTGIFTVDSGYFFHLLMFDDAEVPSTTDPTRTLLIPNGVEREAEMISLDEIWSMIVLWPQSHTPTEGGDEWVFVDV